MPDQTSSVVRFGEYILDRADERLIGPRGPVRIGNKAFRVIDAMVRTRGRLLTKDELFETVWDGTTVSESALTSVIKELRHALQDDRRAPSYIVNVYGRGYRFLPEVQEVRITTQREVPTEPSGSELPPSLEKPRVAERRSITAISVDLTDVAHLYADDPEILVDSLARYRHCVSRCVTAAGGLVVNAASDGLLACFGWPDAREDAAECAIRAGFSIIADIERLGGQERLSLRARIGIATSVVVVGAEMEGATRGITLVGVAPTLAAELRHIAQPGTIAISDTTHRQVSQLFECELLAAPSVGGVSTLPPAWRPLRPTPKMSRFQAIRTSRYAFVGRVHELSLLADRWQMAAEGGGRTVVVLGEAGMGKSRLIDALLGQIADEPHEVIVWQCSPYHQANPLYPVADYLAYAAEIADTDAPAAKLRKLTELLAAAQVPLESNLALLAHLLSIPPEVGYTRPATLPNQTRAATITALIEWLHRVAAAKPLLFVLEDAHWIDATTLELLTRLVGSIGDASVLAVITARPEFSSPWSGRAEVSTIGLDRLNDRDCATLAGEIVGSIESCDVMVAKVVARSDGNPLYVEELSAAVLDTNATAISSVPDSLLSSLMTRLEGLGAAKEVAQICSVLGRRFARPLLNHVSDLAATQLEANLALLVERDVIRPIGGADDGRYEFKHALLRDATYESMLLSVRRRMHEAAGLSLEKYFPDVARTEPELLSQHFSSAGLTVEAGAYSELAGDRAVAACAFQEAIASYQEALRHNDTQPVGADRDRRTLDLLLKLGPAVALVRGAQDPELRDIYCQAEILSQRVYDDYARFKAVWGLWYSANIGRELDEADKFAQELVTIAEHLGDEELTLEAGHCRWSSALFGADYRRCLTDARHGAQLYDRHRHHKLGLVFGGHDPGVCAFGCLGQAQIYAGDVAEGFESVQSSIALAEELDHPATMAHGLLMGLIIGTVTYTLDTLQSYAERTLELSHRFKLPPQEAIGSYHLAWIEAEAGNRDKGVKQMAALHDRVTAIGPITLLYKVMYVEQLLKAGRVRESLAAAEAAIVALRCPDRGLLLSELFRLRGECLFALDRSHEGGDELTRAEAMARRDGARLLRLRAANSLYENVGELSRPILEAAFKAMPHDCYGQEILDARKALAR